MNACMNFFYKIVSKNILYFNESNINESYSRLKKQTRRYNNH